MRGLKKIKIIEITYDKFRRRSLFKNIFVVLDAAPRRNHELVIHGKRKKLLNLFREFVHNGVREKFRLIDTNRQNPEFRVVKDFDEIATIELNDEFAILPAQPICYINLQMPVNAPSE